MIGSTPISPRSNLPIARGVIWCSVRVPLRSIDSVIGWLAFGRTATENSSQFATGSPFTATIRSPIWRPASAATDLAVTEPMTEGSRSKAGICAPW